MLKFIFVMYSYHCPGCILSAWLVLSPSLSSCKYCQKSRRLVCWRLCNFCIWQSMWCLLAYFLYLRRVLIARKKDFRWSLVRYFIMSWHLFATNLSKFTIFWFHHGFLVFLNASLLLLSQWNCFGISFSFISLKFIVIG